MIHGAYFNPYKEYCFAYKHSIYCILLNE